MSKPNVLLVMTDQQRGDCLGIEGHTVLQTPYLDALATSGARFSRAYAACPVCIPARRTVMSGRTPAHHGVFANHDCPLDGPTLADCFSRAGYQTHLAGKLHLHPKRKLYGFHSADLADGPGGDPKTNDYTRFLIREGVHQPQAAFAHGMNGNGWPTRPWHLDERLHITTWTADRALDFLDRRDPTLPFFLKLSFFHPHTPCTPPACYYDRYLGLDLPTPVIGDWCQADAIPQRGMPIISPRMRLTHQQQHQFQAGYFGCIDHIDSQLGRVLNVLPRNTIILFCSDHGDMLGDHGYSRKGLPYEGSARIPFLLRLPADMGIAPGQVLDAPVELMDVMPTLLDAAGLSIPESVDGRSVLPLLRGERDWRPFVHGETAVLAEPDGILRTGMQYLTDGHRKYIWFPGLGREQYFDLDHDPAECHDLATDPTFRDELAIWRNRLVEQLTGRPEGFVHDGALCKLDGPTAYVLP